MIIVYIVLKNKIRDELGCAHDIWYSLIVVAISIILSQILHLELNAFLPFFIMNSLGLFITFYPLYLLRKYYKYNPAKEKESSMPSQPTVDRVNSLSKSNRTDINIDMKQIMTDLSHPLHKFLKTKPHNDLFADYLVFCFVIENIMFASRAIVFYHFVFKYAKVSDDEIKVNKVKCFQLKFLDLDNVNHEYKSMLNDVDDNEQDFIKLRPYF